MTLVDFMRQWHGEATTLEVRTSGSTGKPKVIRVEKSRMLASARMTCDFLGLASGDTALLCMPLDYIAGKMMVVRSIERGLHLLSVDPSGHPLSDDNVRALGLHRPGKNIIDLAAMVPPQVWNTLQVPEERKTLCRHVRHLIIGGGAIAPEMEQELCSLPVHSWSSYGMTETLSHIALRRMGEPCYTPLPGISVDRDSDGCLIIDAPALCPSRLVTNDIAEFVDGNRFRILGRRDNTVCSGGIKIQIEEVEAWLRSRGIKDVAVTWRPDPRLGQALVYLTTAGLSPSDLFPDAPTQPYPIPGRPDTRYWLPRDIIHVDALPLTPTGKPDRAKAQRLATGQQIRPSKQ